MTVAQLILALLRQDPARAVYVQGRAGQTLIARTVEGTPRLDILEITGTKTDDPGTPNEPEPAVATEQAGTLAPVVEAPEPEPITEETPVAEPVVEKRKPGRPKKVK